MRNLSGNILTKNMRRFRFGAHGTNGYELPTFQFLICTLNYHYLVRVALWLYRNIFLVSVTLSLILHTLFIIESQLSGIVPAPAKDSAREGQGKTVVPPGGNVG